MARTRDISTFDRTIYASTVKSMRALGEEVHSTGRSHIKREGRIHQLVDATQNRGSHNAMIPDGDSGNFILVNGIAMPIVNQFDGTGSTAVHLEKFFLAAERQYDLLAGARTRYNTQLASSVVQDVCDVHESPVVQLSQFESDERSAEQVRLLVPAGDGGDATEDYDLGLVLGLLIYADLWTYYGLKGYFTLTADEIGRGFVTRDGIKRYLGQSLDFLQGGTKMITADLCERNSEKWHQFFLQVPSGSRMLEYTTSWWTEVLGPGRVLRVNDPRLLAEVRAGIVYVTEVLQPDEKGLADFLQASGLQSVKSADISAVWQILQVAQDHFGAQAKLPGYGEIPHPGDKFSHFRHAWPIGHPRESENVTPDEVVKAS